MSSSAARKAFLVDSANEVSLGDPLDPQGTGGLRDESDGTYVNDATVTLEAVEDEDSGADLSGSLTLPLAMPYVTGSNGVYAATVPIGAVIVVGQRAILRVNVVDNATLSRVFNIRVYGKEG